MALFSDGQALMAMADCWDVDFQGSSYLASSLLDRNHVLDISARYLDTEHDLRNPVQFEDFMDARASQALELAKEIGLYREYVSLRDAGRVNDGIDITGLPARYAARAEMALYGFRSDLHMNSFSDYVQVSGELPSGLSRSDMARDIRQGGRVLESRLKSFAEDWAAVSRIEDLVQSKPSMRRHLANAIVGGADMDETFLIRSEPFLYRYVAENEGRNEYFRRVAAFNGDSYSVPGVDVKPYVPSGGGFVVHYDEDTLNRLRDICANKDGSLGRGSSWGTFAFDGESLVRALGAPDQPQAEHTRSIEDIEAVTGSICRLDRYDDFEFGM